MPLATLATFVHLLAPHTTPLATFAILTTLATLIIATIAKFALGVQPDAVKPIGWLNEAHYENLKANNALDPTLARRIEAFRQVSSSDPSVAEAV